MATHSSALAWKIPWAEEPGRLQSMRSQRVGHDWATSLSLFTFMHWRRKWQPTPVFLPGESQGRRSLVGCCLRGRTRQKRLSSSSSSKSSTHKRQASNFQRRTRAFTYAAMPVWHTLSHPCIITDGCAACPSSPIADGPSSLPSPTPSPSCSQ